MTIWETEFPFLIIKWCPIIIFSEVPWWLKLSYLTQGHKEVPEGPKAKLQADDLHSRMYHSVKDKQVFFHDRNTRQTATLALLLTAPPGKNGFLWNTWMSRIWKQVPRSKNIIHLTNSGIKLPRCFPWYVTLYFSKTGRCVYMKYFAYSTTKF